jgi:hypothetical protein
VVKSSGEKLNPVVRVLRDEYLDSIAEDMTDLQRRLAEVYITDGVFNVKKTAAIVGCGISVAKNALYLPAVKQYIDELLDRQGWKLKGVRNDILREQVAVARGNIAEVEFETDEQGRLNVASLVKLPKRVQRAIRRLKVTERTNEAEGWATRTIEVEMHDKNSAAVTLGKWLGLEVEAKKEVEAARDRGMEQVQLVGVKLIGPEENWAGF